MGGLPSVKTPAAAPARPGFSPFVQDKSRRRPEGAASAQSTPMPVAHVAPPSVPETRGATAVSVAPEFRPALQSIPMPMPAPVKLPDAMPLHAPSHVEQSIEQEADVPLPSPVFETTAPPPRPAIALASAPDPDALKAAVVDALTTAGQESAADAMSDASWAIVDNEARVQTALSQTMLPHVVNSNAEKIARAALRELGVAKLTLLPGALSPVAEKKPRPARTGSVQQKALEHPMVQQAQKLFQAEIQTVIDLREGD
jgi:DNA polymerase-3 subunit gamma/tau